MTTDNSFYRLARPDETPTHFAQGEKIYDYAETECDAESKIILLIKLGWFPPEQKPEKDGEYFCALKDNTETWVSTRVYQSGWNDADDCEVLAWAEIPPFTQEKDNFKEWLKKNHPKIIDDFDLERAMELKKGWDKSMNTEYGEKTMTLPSYSELSDEHKAKMVATEMGWKLHNQAQAWFNFSKNDGCGTFTGFVKKDWNPSHSLDQCFLMEEWLLENHEELMDLYESELFNKIFPMWHAIASQRCHAFLLTMGKVRE